MCPLSWSTLTAIVNTIQQDSPPAAQRLERGPRGVLSKAGVDPERFLRIVSPATEEPTQKHGRMARRYRRSSTRRHWT